MKHFQMLGVPILLVLTMFSALLCSIAPVSAMGSPTPPVHRVARTASLLRPDLKAEAQWFQLSHFGKTLPASNARILALQQASGLPQFGAPWRSLGPAPVNSVGCNGCLYYGFNSGRITALAVNPSNSNDLWAGAADGGAWHSTDGGAHWAPVTDSLASLSIGAIAIDPANPTTIYLGTGEANHNVDAYWGVGIFKSTDGGQHWTQLGFSQFGGLSIARIAIDPANTSHLLAAVGAGPTNTLPGGGSACTNQGIWRSIDGGANWTEVLTDQSCDIDAATDVLFDPAHPGVAFAGLGNIAGISSSTKASLAGVYKSVDDGTTWKQLSNGIPTGNSIGRAALGISQDGNHLYGVLAYSGTGSSVTNDTGDLLNNAVYVSTDNGASWTATDVSTLDGCSMANDSCDHNWWYESAVAVDPTIATGSTAYIGGEDLWQTTDGGATWTNITNVSTVPGMHPAQHAIVFLSRTSSSYYLGNDGGVWSGTNAGAFTNLNTGGLNITQFYSASIGEVGADAQLYGGIQGNGVVQLPTGTALVGPTQWTQVFWSGDLSGGNTIVDYTNNAVIYIEWPGAIFKSTDGGVTWFEAVAGIARGDPANFFAPLVMSQTNDSDVLVGTDKVYQKLTDVPSGWVAISPALDSVGCDGRTTCPLSALAIAASNNNFIYAGDNNGSIFVTTNGGTSWSGGPVAGSAPGIVTSLAVDPTNPSVAYATFADFAPNGAAGEHVFKTVNAGKAWTDISKSLPDIPFESVVVSPRSPQLVVAGSDAGVFASFNGGTTWRQLGSGLPNVAIDQVFTNHTGTKLFVATHGRGLWEFPLNQML